MTLSELHRIVNLHYSPDYPDDPELMIAIKLPYATVGSLPMVKVKSMNMGFDWEAGRFIIWPEEDLTPSDRDFAKQMKKMQEELGLTKNENRRLKAEINNLKKQLGKNSEEK
jgi:hypothetical protein